MINKVEAFIRKHHMIEKGNHVLVGISGGADSVCLLLVLNELKNRIGFTMSGVHVEHGIRGEESVKDEIFTRSLCKKLGIEIAVYKVDALLYAKEHKLSLEEGARILRYDCFRQELKKRENSKMAVAHHMNDQSETIFFHMLRGTNLPGMCGMLSVRGDIIRPLLTVTREEIEGYLKKEHQGYCEDATNFQVEYARNKIRHEVIPVLKEVNPKVVEHMYELSEELKEIEEYLKEETKKAYDKVVVSNEIQGLSFQLLPKVIQQRVIYLWLENGYGKKKDITKEYVKSVLELFSKQVGKRICLKDQRVIERTYQCVAFQEMIEEKQDDIILLKDHKDFKIRILDASEIIGKIQEKSYTKWLDYDKIKNTLVVRNRRTGDYFQLSDEKKQTLKKYFVNEKVPGQKRNEIPLVAEENHILWIVGYRISDYYKVSKDTKRIIEIRYEGEK